MEKRALSLLVKQKALQLGFSDFGIAKAEPLRQEEAFLKSWLLNGYHAGMTYMANNQDKRLDPGKLMEGTRSVICLLSNYKPTAWQDPELPQIASYAYGADYHVVLKERLHLLRHFIDEQLAPSASSSGKPLRAHMRLFTDTAPVLERAWAARAGLGWIGKSSLLISPRYGPFTFISVILIDIDLEYDTPMQAQCGNCNRCINACPTGALCAPHVLDAGRCISYHTIESTEPCAVASKPYIFGCDACLRACPWGTGAPSTTLFPPLPGLLSLSAPDWREMSNETFRKRFAGSALERAGLEKIQETLRIFT